MRQIILDTETTGLEHAQGHRIIEIAAVEMINRKVTAPDRHFHRFINPERDIDEGAQRVHGLSREFLEDKPVFARIAQDFLDFVAGAELIIHNAPFDTGFLNAELARLGLGKIEEHVSGVVDTLVWARELFPGKRNSLDALCDRFEVDRSARTLHGALIDCELLSEVYLCMTRGQDSLLMDLPMAGAETGQSGQAGALRWRADHLFVPSAEDLALHAEYLAALDKAAKAPCVWRVYQPAESAV